MMRTLLHGLFLPALLLLLAAGAVKGQEQSKEEFISSLLSKMTLEEKIGQMTLFTSGWSTTGPALNENYKEDVKSGRCGNIFNARSVEYNRELQKMAVEESRLGIPLMFGLDVIHGHRTMFPIPLAESCSWDLSLIKESARLSAREAAANGLNWTFNPMVDITRDPRWGRIAEGAGEDPYLASKIAAAKVKGYQGDDLDDPLTLAACMKHFAGYGAAQAGRDYHTVNMSERRLREIFLPPFKAAKDAGVASVMTAFNELNGIPATANKFLFQDILRDEWNFEGMVVTDYTSINEMVNHGYARDLAHAGELAANAGVDMDMQGGVFKEHLKERVEAGKVSEERINNAVRNVLGLKYDLGLFEDPYRYLDKEREAEIVLSDELMDHALEAGKKSIVLLKNEAFEGEALLPLSEEVETIALIGPMAEERRSLMGTWTLAGDGSKVVTVKEGLQKRFPSAKILTARGTGYTDHSVSGFPEAKQIAKEADVVIMAVGENFMQSGEAASRSKLGLPGAQQQLVKEIHALGKPVAGLVMAGRPLAISWMDKHLPAILYAWHLGTRHGDAVAGVISGDYNPSARLVSTFPRNVGQIPIHYNMKNTGRPFDPNNKYTSKYLDVPNSPLYPFGYGLSYTTFAYEGLELSSKEIAMNETLEVQVEVTNTGRMAGEEVVQLYTRDLVGSVTRPVKELKGFKKIALEPGESRKVTFSLTADDLRFYDADMKLRAEPGEFKVFVGRSSADVLEAGFTLKE